MSEPASPPAATVTPAPGAARLVATKRIAKDVYTTARDRGSQAIPARLQQVAAATTGVARLVVVGERKRGKSTLINAMLDAPGLLPRDVDVATNTYIEIVSPRRLGKPVAPAAIIHLQSGASHEVDLATIGRWASEAGNPGNARGVAYVQVLLPHPLLDAGLVIVDTPGLGGLASSHGTMTLAALQQADAVLVMLGGSAPASTDELAFVGEVHQRTPRVLVVESAGPEALDPGTVVAADRSALDARSRVLGLLPILVVAPLDAHDALTMPDPLAREELRRLSNIDNLVGELERRVVGPVLDAQAEALAAELRSCLDELDAPDAALLQAVAGGDPAAAAATARAALADAERRSPVGTFDAAFVELRRELESTLQLELGRRRDELLDDIEDRWSASLAGTLVERCRALLADVATLVGDRMAERAGAIAVDAAQRSGLGLPAAVTLPDRPELTLDADDGARAARRLDTERMLGWLARGGPMLMIGVVTANPLLVGIGVVVVVANEQIQGASTNRRRAREQAQRLVTRGQAVLRTALDERAAVVRDAYVRDLSARHEARLEQLRATVSAVERPADVEGARRRAGEVAAHRAALAALGPAAA